MGNIVNGIADPSNDYFGVTRQSIINGNFSVNQLIVSGTVTLAAGVYGHDMWKAGAGGCTYTFATVNNVTTITITAGSLIQVIDGINLQSGTYTLSWTGTAQGKIGAGSYGATGISGTAVGGTNLNIEFNTGTLSKVQFNAGSIALSFQPKSYDDEERACMIYFEKSYDRSTAPGAVNYTYAPILYTSSALAASTAGNVGGVGYLAFKVRKRANPIVTFYDYDGTANAIRIQPLDAKRSGLTLIANIKDTGTFQYLSFDNSSATAVAAGSTIGASWTADARL